MPTVSVEVEIDDCLEELSDRDLLDELERRGGVEPDTLKTLYRLLVGGAVQEAICRIERMLWQRDPAGAYAQWQKERDEAVGATRR